MITINGVVSMLVGATPDKEERHRMLELAVRSGLMWVCTGCGCRNDATDETCKGDKLDTCSVRPIVHLGSATTVHPGGDTSRFHTLALCGEDLGPMADYTGPSGNYLTPRSTTYATVTCPPCREWFEVWHRQRHATKISVEDLAEIGRRWTAAGSPSHQFDPLKSATHHCSHCGATREGIQHTGVAVRAL